MRDLTTLPKAHLHLHFTGSLRPSTLHQLAIKHDIRLPVALLDGEPLKLPPDRRGWFRFQRLYDAARACVVDEQDVRRVVREAIEDDAAEGSRRLEIQIDPSTYARNLGGITPVMEIVTDEARLGAAATGLSVGVIVAASRLRHPLDARALARLAAKFAGDGDGQVVGFGLSNDERRGVTSEFAPAFAIARRAGLAGVPHGGELLGADHLAQVFDSLAPDRIGHGVRAVENRGLLARIVDSGVALEVCPTSNVCLGVADTPGQVPLPDLLNAGATIALGADDPLLFTSRLVDQYRLARDVHGLDDAQLAALAKSSIEASRADPIHKRRWRADIDDWLATDSSPHASVPGEATSWTTGRPTRHRAPFGR